MSMIFSRAPLRISLGGGGTDLPSYYKDHGGFLISGAIDKYVYLLTHTVFQKQWRMKYAQTEEVATKDEIKHPIFREALKLHWEGAPVEIASVADVPSGTGLGSSGTFTVALMKGLAIARRQSRTPGALTEDACHIEIDVLGEPVGKQDQYVAAHGGICAYTFNQDGSVDVEPLNLSTQTLDDLKTKLMLFYTGETRSASKILGDQNKRTESSDQSMVDNLHRTKEIGYHSRELLESGDLDAYAALMHEHWLNKMKRSPGMANERIEGLYDTALKSGALGGKLVGAGGGGFLLVYTHDPAKTREAMHAQDAPELPFDFDFQGATGSYFG